MCGIAGFIAQGLNNPNGTLDRMSQALAHRGPDGTGSWFDASSGAGFAHRRLAILELSPLGHQPMTSVSGRYVITFNGEVFNYRELKDDLQSGGHLFRGTSDTEVMLAAFEQWGIVNAVRRFNGMFAFAVFDRAERTLSLVRDRIGVKPLYYGWSGDNFLFSSELEALRKFDGFAAPIDRKALSLMLQLNHVPAPWSAYEGIYKLSAGSLLCLPTERHLAVRDSFCPFTSKKGENYSPRSYWTVTDYLRTGDSVDQRSYQEICDQVHEVLSSSVKLRMLADVPVGVFLSGGIDSSLVTAVMQQLSAGQVRTFSLGFDNPEFDESNYAAQVARHLGTQHTALMVSSSTVQDTVRDVCGFMDEPLGDSSFIPMLLVSRLARRDVTVCLSGDGGDELFGGYNRYLVPRLFSDMRRLPDWLRRGLGQILSSIPQHFVDSANRRLLPYLPKRWKFASLGDKLGKLAIIAQVENVLQLYWSSVSSDYQLMSPGALCGTWAKGFHCLEQQEHNFDLDNGVVLDSAIKFMILDLLGCLPDDMLVKVDRASMRVGLEAREPLLDYRLVELALALPTEYKIGPHPRKRILRDLLERYVPRNLIDRPKHGFGVPLAQWLRGPLHDFAQKILFSSPLFDLGLVSPIAVDVIWSLHQRGKRDFHSEIWNLMVASEWVRQKH
jgi:asparagine synthase (glutamine-hydrolysing)